MAKRAPHIEEDDAYEYIFVKRIFHKGLGKHITRANGKAFRIRVKRR